MGRLPSLSLSARKQVDVATGIWEMQGFLPESPDFQGVEGFLSLNFFKDASFTMDYQRGSWILEDDAGLRARVKTGRVIPLELVEDGPALTIFMRLQIPGGEPLRVEVDLGGNILTLNAKHMKRLGVDPAAASVRREERAD
jgi:hypothetical protein